MRNLCTPGLAKGARKCRRKRRHHSFLHLHMRSCSLSRLAGELETVEESIRQPCSGLAQAVTNPWPMESLTCVGFLLEFFACAHIGGCQFFNCEIGMLMTHSVHTILISYLDQSAHCLLSLLGPTFCLRRECADFRLPLVDKLM
jgi:hypothetical protein